MPATLLLADDSATIQRVIEMTFAEEDVRVVTVGDGREAIERIAADPPDIVLADTNMPEKDGYEVSAFVKGESARSGIPVVLLTGAFEPVDDERAREVGCDAVLVKPFEPTAVLARVRELLGLPADGGAEAPAAAEAVADAPVAGPDASTADPDSEEPAAADAPVAAADASPADPDPEEPAAADASAADPDAAAPAEDAASAAPDAAAPVEDALPAGPDPAAPAAQRDAAPGDTPAAGGAAAPPAVPAVEAPAPPSLAEAFASLLAAEQGDLDRARAAYPWPRRAEPADDDLVERVAERVVERLSSDVTGELVSEVVARVAERLVREQIGRIGPS